MYVSLLASPNQFHYKVVKCKYWLVGLDSNEGHVDPVSLPAHTFPGQVKSSKRLTITYAISFARNNYPSWINGREIMTVQMFHDQPPRKSVAGPGGDRTRNLQIISQTRIRLRHRGRQKSVELDLFQSSYTSFITSIRYLIWTDTVYTKTSILHLTPFTPLYLDKSTVENRSESKLKNIMANCVEHDETAHIESSHLDLHCLH